MNKAIKNKVSSIDLTNKISAKMLVVHSGIKWNKVKYVAQTNCKVNFLVFSVFYISFCLLNVSEKQHTALLFTIKEYIAIVKRKKKSLCNIILSCRKHFLFSKYSEIQTIYNTNKFKLHHTMNTRKVTNTNHLIGLNNKLEVVLYSKDHKLIQNPTTCITVILSCRKLSMYSMVFCWMR